MTALDQIRRIAESQGVYLPALDPRPDYRIFYVETDMVLDPQDADSLLEGFDTREQAQKVADTLGRFYPQASFKVTGVRING